MKNISKSLSKKIETIPLKPGIYKMKDIEGNILYVGKSKTLKSRVKSYFYGDHEWEKIKRMVFNIHDIDYIVTDTHLEAQILECSLIKKLQPIYNKQFKNDKKYLYLKIESYNRFKPISTIEERENKYCFGPYRNKNILFDTVKFFQSIYPILKDKDSYDFDYKILPEQIDKDTFEKNRQCLIEIFSNKESQEMFLYNLKEHMDNVASKLQFERALIYRDMIHNMQYVYDNNTNELQEINSRQILLREKLENGYKIFYISNDRVILKKKYDKITKECLEEFLIRAGQLEIKAKLDNAINEKRNLDFKKIIQNEIKSADSKNILFLDGEYNLAEWEI